MKDKTCGLPIKCIVRSKSKIYNFITEANMNLEK